MLKKTTIAMAAVFVAFHLYTAAFGVLPGIAQKATHLGLILVSFFLYQMLAHKGKIALQLVDFVLIAMSVASSVYIIAIDKNLSLRSGIIYVSDLVFGVMLVLAILEATRRCIGNSLAIVVGVFIIYGFFGKYFPGPLQHSGFTLSKFVSLTCLTTDGIYGTALYASARYIVLFIILGSIMNETGIGTYFTNVATCLFGRMKGGPAKVSVIASGLFGSINGSAIANVIGTGTFTIPLMKKSGFAPEYAAGVEAASSTGGQIMPPIMGATAFLMAEFLGVAYVSIVKAAVLPAVLYFAAILFSVDVYARKHNLAGMDADKVKPLRELMKEVYLLFPLVFLIVAMAVLRWTITKSGLYTILVTLVLVSISKKTRINKERLVKIIEGSLNGAIPVAIACGVVGIIIGVVMGSGLGFRLSSILIEISSGRLPLLLLLTMVTSLILGMGMPTTAAYLVLAVLVAPAMVKLGVPRIAAHMFIFYFGIISTVTPPVALAAYAAAGLAKCSPTKAGYKAFRLSISGFILPFMFVYNNVLLMEGGALQIIWSFGTALLGVYLLSCALEGYFIKWKIIWPESVLLLAAALTLIIPGWVTDAIGLAVALVLSAVHWALEKRQIISA